MNKTKGPIVFELADADRTLLIEALGGYAMRYDNAKAERCAELAATFETAVSQGVSVLDAEDRALVRKALQGGAPVGRAERHAAELLEARLHADDIAQAIRFAQEPPPDTERPAASTFAR